MTKRAISVAALARKKFIEMPLEGDWQRLIGTPERSGSWFISGESGHGKTSFLMLLAKELTRFGKVAYNSLEEGARSSMQSLMDDFNMKAVGNRFVLLNREPIDELSRRLARQRSPDIVIIDSVQYSFLDTRSYKRLTEAHPRKLFIFSSHAEGKRPVGRTARSIEFDADVKIHVEGFKAFCRSRHSRGVVPTPYVIWEEGANAYWINKNK